MAKNKQKASKNSSDEIIKPEVSEKTEKIFKKILKIMSWTVGICFILIIILPMFENYILDVITKILFNIGAITLIIFTLIEFVSDFVKIKIEKLIEHTS
jgi:hypothetical protein